MACKEVPCRFQGRGYSSPRLTLPKVFPQAQLLPGPPPPPTPLEDFNLARPQPPPLPTAHAMGFQPPKHPIPPPLTVPSYTPKGITQTEW